MSTIIKNLVRSAITQPKIKAIFFNAKNYDELKDFDAEIYTLDNIHGPNVINITQKLLEMNLAIEFTHIINLRPYLDNIQEIMGIAERVHLPLCNFIIEINDQKPEHILHKSQLIEDCTLNFIKNKELASGIYLPNKNIGNEKDFITCLKSI